MRSHWLTLTCVLLAMTLIAACGVKSLPKPPAQEVPPLVTGLEISVTDDRAVLTWPIPAWEDASDELSGFTVLRAATPVDELSCETCPVRYEQIANPPIQPEDAEQGKMVFTDRLEKGYRYQYKVSAYSEEGAFGKASEPKSVNY